MMEINLAAAIRAGATQWLIYGRFGGMEFWNYAVRAVWDTTSAIVFWGWAAVIAVGVCSYLAMKGRSTVRRKVITLVIAVIGLYAICPLILFDWKEPAEPFDEETFAGKPVAFGPRPFWYLCTPSYANWFYDGSEWPFIVYRPVCEVWLRLNKMEKPHQWRS